MSTINSSLFTENREPATRVAQIGTKVNHQIQGGN